MLHDRIEQLRITKKMQKQEMALHLGITEQKYSKIIHGNYDGSFEEYESFVNRLGETPDDKYFIATGKHLQQEPEQKLNCTSEIQMLSNTIKDLSKIITHLSAKMDQLSAEISHMREGKESGTKLRVREKVPDH